MKTLILTEHQEQANFVSTVRFEYRNDDTFIDGLFFSTLNGAWLGGKRSFSLWQKHQKEGAKRGVADLLYLQPRGGFTFLAIEMKRSDRRKEKNGGVTEDELAWQATAKNNGAYVAVCYSADEAKECFDKYMKLQKM